jgi:hypothetical protein
MSGGANLVRFTPRKLTNIKILGGILSGTQYFKNVKSIVKLVLATAKSFLKKLKN